MVSGMSVGDGQELVGVGLEGKHLGEQVVGERHLFVTGVGTPPALNVPVLVKLDNVADVPVRFNAVVVPVRAGDLDAFVEVEPALVGRIEVGNEKTLGSDLSVPSLLSYDPEVVADAVAEIVGVGGSVDGDHRP